MKLYLVTNEGELLETWRDVEKDWLYSHPQMKLCAMEIRDSIERFKGTENGKDGSRNSSPH